MLLKLGRLIGAALVAGILVAALSLPAVGGVGITARDVANDFRNMPTQQATDPVPEKTRVLANDGSVIATFYYHNRESVPLHRVAPVMRKAIIAIEDSRFYQHGGLDPKGVLRAVITNASSGEVQQGGSTLTQQYVKNLLKESAKTEAERRAAEAPNLSRKIRELRYALEVEKRMSKDQILEGYLNLAYFGLGAYGIEAASRRYFDKPASKLALHEAATLAGLVRNPPATLDTEAAVERRNVVLKRMADLKMISPAEAAEASKKKLRIRGEGTDSGGCEPSKAPFFCEYVKHEILNNPRFGKTRKDREAFLLRGGLTIRTTLDPVAQKAAQRGLRAYVDPLDPQAAAQAMIEPGTGKIRAIAVSKKFGPDSVKGATSINLAADQAHGGGAGLQAGSTFKAFTLATALKEGISPNRPFKAPGAFPHVGFRNCKGQDVSNPSAPPVKNASGEGKAGTYTLRTGTWNSVNTFFMLLEREVGLCDTVKTAKALGIERTDGKPLREFSTFTLGINEVDPVTVAAAFATFAARGTYCRPFAIESITDMSGKTLSGLTTQSCKAVLDEDVADQVNDILSGVFTKGTMRGVGGIGRPAAGKTGTTDGSSSAWFAGYTPDLSSAVALGDLRGAYQYPLRNVRIGGRYYGTVFGATISGRIWKQSMIAALADTPKTPFKTPLGSDGEDGEQEVPDVSGLRVGEAEARLDAAGFTVVVEGRRVESDVPPGRVAGTEPKAGEDAAPGSTVRIFISRGGDDD